MIGEENNLDAGFFCGGEDFGAGALGMIGILGMHMDDRAKILEGADVGNFRAQAGEAFAGFVRGLELGRGEALRGGEACEVGLGGLDCECGKQCEAQHSRRHGVTLPKMVSV